MTSENMEVLSSENYDDFIKNWSGIIICHKPLCPHCRIMGKVLEKAGDMREDICFASVDSVAQPELLARMEVERVPTLCAVKNGTITARRSGVMNPVETIAWYEKAV